MPADQGAKGGSSEPRALGRLIVYLRMEKGASQQDLAKTIGTSKSQLSKWERGQVNPRVPSREKIAAAFAMSRHDFEELAQRVDRTVIRNLARLQSHGHVVDPTRGIDEKALRSRLEEARLRRRDLEAERAEIDEAIRGIDRDENFLQFELNNLPRS